MGNLLEEVKTVVDELLGHAQQVKEAVDTAVSAPNAEQAFLDAVVVALEAAGYTVTPPAKVTKVQVQDANAEGAAGEEAGESADQEKAEGDAAPNA